MARYPKGSTENLPDHLQRETVTIRLPKWLKKKLREKYPGDAGNYLEKLLLNEISEGRL